MTLEASSVSHEHFTRLQRAKGAMDPIVTKAFDELIKRMDEQSSRSAERWERLEKRIEEVTQAMREYEQATDSRIASLEDFASSQYTAAVVADNWGSHFDSRVSDLEQRMADLELIRLSEIRDERDDRMEDLEGVVGELQAWRQDTEGYIDDVRYDLRRLRRSDLDPAGQHLPRADRELVAAEQHPGGKPTDWPKGHGVESTTRVPDYRSESIVVPSPANGTYGHPTSLLFPAVIIPLVSLNPTLTTHLIPILATHLIPILAKPPCTPTHLTLHPILLLTFPTRPT